VDVGTALFTARCLDCQHEWVTEWPENTRRVECSACKNLNTEKCKTNTEGPKRVYEKEIALALEKRIRDSLEDPEYRLGIFTKLGILEAVKLSIIVGRND